jgi:8-oxo-(d)GTP phosphatase
VPGREPAPDLRAAGGVVWRVRGRVVEVAVVHRPRYDDWSLPKGKLERGEHELLAAVREVGEETGARVTVSRRLPRVAYDVEGRRKHVSFWLMRWLDGAFVPGDEVDALEWLPVDEARERLTYPVERPVLAEVAAVPLPDSVVVLVRHAKAGKRSEWSGEDRLRPLERSGRAQADRLVEPLRVFGPDRVLSTDRVRCVQTVEPLAAVLGLGVEVDAVFGDAAFADSPRAVEDAVLGLAKPGQVSVVCSQGDAIPGLIERLRPGASADTRKGAAWVLSLVDGAVLGADYYDDIAR